MSKTPAQMEPAERARRPVNGEGSAPSDEPAEGWGAPLAGRAVEVDIGEVGVYRRSSALPELDP